MSGEHCGIYPIMGTMTIGAEGQVKPAAAGVLLRTFVGAGAAKVPEYDNRVMIDTARLYQQSFGDGADTESTLRSLFDESPSLRARCHMASKAAPSVPPHSSLSKESVLDQCNTSLQRLDTDCVDLYYLHWPDINTDIDETLDALKQLHEEGKFKELGISNYPAWMVVDIWHRCKAKGMVQPTVYEGMYNMLTRTLEPELVAVVRNFGMRLYIYNPLAGGLLTGRYNTIEDIQNATEGRFSSEFDNAMVKGSKAGQMYQQRYSKKGLFDAISIIKTAIDEVNGVSAEVPGVTTVQESSRVVDGVTYNVRVEETEVQAKKQGLTMVDVALRWLLHHSYLSKGDGVILGFSKPEQLSANLAAWQGGPLPQKIVDACEMAGQIAAPVAESYFRGLGAKSGSIEKFLAKKADEASAKRQKTQ
eukprot:CAMPEP_0206455224 /NCGR_PEP_ID=MMETSP0324_2-20121206/21622_1 /ASSEMBLY_ACC=CAM_ASM_000836 /TAXON_ID=2866 /ORGANISM="Crypthecodinium cohnii, Strain Seligo" /LENGTH=417 /DNA_ID=CAMNT_0053925881 /DNA_START=99 /DNA_END=1352 /DNA_ORIENTATION=+